MPWLAFCLLTCERVIVTEDLWNLVGEVKEVARIVHKGSHLRR